MSDELAPEIIATLDRFERWRETTAAALPKDERFEKEHLYSFGWWPDAEILRQAEIGFCYEASQDSRFWKNGDIRKPASVLMQLEIVLRYGPHAIDEADIDDLAEAVRNMLGDVPFERIDTEAPDNICTLLRDTIFCAKSDEAKKAWNALEVVYQDEKRKALVYLIPDCIHRPTNHPDDVKQVVRFCAAADVDLLDDTGWLVPDWRNRAIVAMAKVIGQPL